MTRMSDFDRMQRGRRARILMIDMRALPLLALLCGCTTMVEPGVLRALAGDEPGGWRVVEGADGNSFRLDAVTQLRVQTVKGWLPARLGHTLRLSHNELVLDEFVVPWVDVQKIEVYNMKPAWPFSLAPILITAN